MATIWSVGQVARILADVTDISGAFADPTSIEVRIQPPTGAIVEDAPVRDSAGRYHYDLSLTAAGVYTYWWAATGENQSAGGGKITVQEALVNGQ